MHNKSTTSTYSDLLPEDVISTFKENLTCFDSLCIGINGFKGGNGNTYLTNALATAGIQSGLRVAVAIAHRECNNNWIKYFGDYDFSNSNLKIYDCIKKMGEDLDNFLPDLILIDFPQGAFTGFHHHRELEELGSQLIDVLLSPVALDKEFHIDGILRNIGTDEPCAFYRRLIVPLCDRLDPNQLAIELSKHNTILELFSEIILYEANLIKYDLNNPVTPVNFFDEKSGIRYESLLATAIKISKCSSMNGRRLLLGNKSPEFA